MRMLLLSSPPEPPDALPASQHARRSLPPGAGTALILALLMAPVIMLLQGCGGTPSPQEPAFPQSARSSSLTSKPASGAFHRPNLPETGREVPNGSGRFRIRPVEFDNGLRSGDRVSLTFDAGATADGVPLLLPILQRNRVRATFFLTGRFCEKFPWAARSIAGAGMELGNHSYSHPPFTHLSNAAIREQLRRAATSIRRACGRDPAPLFRFPYGDDNGHTIRAVVAAGWQPVGWSLDSLDSVGKSKSESFVADRITRRIHPGDIVLMHVSFPTSALAVSTILAELRRRGIRSVPVSELVAATQAPGAHSIGLLEARRPGKVRESGNHG